METPTDIPSLKAILTADLLEMIETNKDSIKKLQDANKAIAEEVNGRTSKDADAGFAVANKQHGTVHFISGNTPLTAVIDREVKWDSDKLRAVAATLPWETVNRIFKIKLEMPAAMYDAVVEAATLPPEAIAGIKAARTVKYGEPKITAHI